LYYYLLGKKKCFVRKRENGKGKRVKNVSLGKKTWGGRVFIMADIHEEED
jgi:hypothetical protein